MILRHPRREEIPQLAELWSSCFPDAQEDVARFLDQVLRPEYGLVVLQPNGRPGRHAHHAAGDDAHQHQHL